MEERFFHPLHPNRSSARASPDGSPVDVNFTNAAKLDALQESGARTRYRVFNSSSREGEEITEAIDAAKAWGAAALNVLSSPFLYGNRQIVMQQVAALRLPTMYQFPEEAEEGGFVAYGPSIVQIFRELVAPQLVKLLRGVKPADIPVGAADQVRAGDQPQDR